MTDDDRAIADELRLIGLTDSEITALLTRPQPCCSSRRCCDRHFAQRRAVVASKIAQLDDRRTTHGPR
jgi:hypothetical protein